MRILHLQHPYLPGLGYQENYLPFRQQELGHEVKMVTSSLKPNKFDKINQDIRPGKYSQKGVEIARLDPLLYFDSTDQVLLQNIKSEINRFNPDVVHNHGLINPLSIQTAITKINRDFDLFVDTHIDNGNMNIDSLYKKLMFSCYRNIIHHLIDKCVDGYLPVQNSARDFLSENLSIPADRMDLLPLGVDTRKFYPDNNAGNEIRSKLNISPEELLIIFSGNITPSKDINILIDTFSTICDEHDDISLLLLGHGPKSYLANLQAKVDEKSLTDKVIFHDFVDHDNLMKFYNAADIGVFPGKLGITIIEAIATGLPVVLCDDPATELLLSNENGKKFTRGNINELYANIDAYILNDELREKHSAAAVTLASDTLSWESIAKQSVEIYQSI